MKHDKIKLLLLATVIIANSGCFNLFDPGTNSFIKSVNSPDKSEKAILFMKGGNATSDNSLQISIKNYDDSLDEVEVGNIFTVDSNHGKARLNASAITMAWLANNKLEISFDKKLRTFITERRFKNDTILYKPY